MRLLDIRNLKVITGLCLLVVSSLNCKQKNYEFEWPLARNIVWTYKVKGFTAPNNRFDFKYQKSDDKLLEYDLSSWPNFDSIPEFYSRIDSFNRDNFFDKNFDGYDTIQVSVTEAHFYDQDTFFYRLNDYFIRWWGRKIIRIPAGYATDFDENFDFKILIKSPVVLGESWENKGYFFYEKCTVTSLDTTLFLGDITYTGCISIRCDQRIEGSEYLVYTFFHSDYGLVYYKDYTGDDEVILLDMKK